MADSRVIITGPPRSASRYLVENLNRAESLCLGNELNVYGVRTRQGTTYELMVDPFRYLDQLAARVARNYENPDLGEALGARIRVVGGDKSELTKKLVEFCLEAPEIAGYLRQVKNLREEFGEDKQLRVTLEKQFQANGQILEVARTVEDFLFNGGALAGDKLPAYGGVFARILEKLDGTKIILTMRDPLQVARSFLKDRDWDPWWKTEEPAAAVQLVNEIYSGLENSLREVPDVLDEKIYTSKIEALEADLHSGLAELLDFLGVQSETVQAWATENFNYQPAADAPELINSDSIPAEAWEEFCYHRKRFNYE